MLHRVRHLIKVQERQWLSRRSRRHARGHRPAQPEAGPGLSRKPRKRVGRGEGSGTGKTAGRGQKGYGSRSGAKDRARFEGGQMPIHMRMRKLRGPNKKKSMPFEPFRTHTQAVNLQDLEERFDKGAEVTLEALKEQGLGKRRDIPVKILAKGEISKPLTVHAHKFWRPPARPSRAPAAPASSSSSAAPGQSP